MNIKQSLYFFERVERNDGSKLLSIVQTHCQDLAHSDEDSFDEVLTKICFLWHSDVLCLQGFLVNCYVDIHALCMPGT